MVEQEKEYIPVSIVNEGKQLSVRFPAKVVEALEIDPSKDAFVFILDKKRLHLEGVLIDKKAVKDGREKKT